MSIFSLNNYLFLAGDKKHFTIVNYNYRVHYMLIIIIYLLSYFNYIILFNIIQDIITNKKWSSLIKNITSSLEKVVTSILALIPNMEYNKYYQYLLQPLIIWVYLSHKQLSCLEAIITIKIAFPTLNSKSITVMKVLNK